MHIHPLPPDFPLPGRGASMINTTNAGFPPYASAQLPGFDPDNAGGSDDRVLCFLPFPVSFNWPAPGIKNYTRGCVVRDNVGTVLFSLCSFFFFFFFPRLGKKRRSSISDAYTGVPRAVLFQFLFFSSRLREIISLW